MIRALLLAALATTPVNAWTLDCTLPAVGGGEPTEVIRVTNEAGSVSIARIRTRSERLFPTGPFDVLFADSRDVVMPGLESDMAMDGYYTTVITEAPLPYGAPSNAALPTVWLIDWDTPALQATAHGDDRGWIVTSYVCEISGA